MAATENGYTPPFLGGDTDSFGNAVPAVRVLNLFGFNVLGGFFAATGSRDPTRGRMEILTGTGKLTSATINSLVSHFSFILGSGNAAFATTLSTLLQAIVRLRRPIKGVIIES